MDRTGARSSMSRDKVGSVGVDTGRDSAQSCPWGLLTDGLGEPQKGRSKL